jgi:hypothetical protein
MRFCLNLMALVSWSCAESEIKEQNTDLLSADSEDQRTHAQRRATTATIYLQESAAIA